MTLARCQGKTVAPTSVNTLAQVSKQLFPLVTRGKSREAGMGVQASTGAHERTDTLNL